MTTPAKRGWRRIRWDFVVVLLVMLALVLGQSRYDSSRRAVGNRRQTLTAAQMTALQAHICTLLTPPAGQALRPIPPAITAFEDSLYPIAFNGHRFTYATFCPAHH
jgi:hypothetical protein